MNEPSSLADLVTAMDRALPRPVTVRRQQAVYWPTIWLHARRAQMGGSFCINGFPSSGTNWLCQLVSRYFGVPILEPWRRLTPALSPHVFHLHRFVDTPAARERTFYIVRDGRDTLVSRYMKLSPNPNDMRPLAAFEAASGMTYDKARIREQMPAFIEWYFTETRYSAMNWANHVRRAMAMDLTRLRFEDLKADAMAALEPVFAKVSGEPIDRARLADVIDQMDFAKVKARGNGHHKRKSQVGEWREHYTQEARDTFARFAQDALVAAGYEADRSWIDEAPLEPVE
ncbi:sulfotransferase domain-containing protein [Erythrobacter sp. EC-HK427]|uniref:sulfotransferase domain-containing protein n=1 Tax=Erythrobacter sp. EC-HK427 TaxID=2038396 RepID=UPI0012527865|nr:sulfotransferase domain-containing protein [Erythrobacter sp. EC-HK427]VVT14376.1 Sulfotransferase domain-containing protein [Erythrobacter sp. EC-HK427]